MRCIHRQHQCRERTIPVQSAAAMSPFTPSDFRLRRAAHSARRARRVPHQKQTLDGLNLGATASLGEEDWNLFFSIYSLRALLAHIVSLEAGFGQRPPPASARCRARGADSLARLTHPVVAAACKLTPNAENHAAWLSKRARAPAVARTWLTHLGEVTLCRSRAAWGLKGAFLLSHQFTIIIRSHRERERGRAPRRERADKHRSHACPPAPTAAHVQEGGQQLAPPRANE